jgi:SAM-dependent methyltransferase
MHASSFENMQKCFRRYVADRLAGATRAFSVLDIGGADVNGSYAEIFPKPAFEYMAADLSAGPGVGMILEDPYALPAANDSFDFVLSGQMLEHCEYFWRSFAEMVRVVRPDGLIFLIAPSAGPIHQYPVDCYRFYPDSFRALAAFANCHLVDLWHDDRGPWDDLVGVFSKTPRAANRVPFPDAAAAVAVNSYPVETADPALNKVRGAAGYLDVLKRLHEELQPKPYLEIGVRQGRSLALAKEDAVGVDPDPDVSVGLAPGVEIICKTSDDFFEDGAHPILKRAPELVFIDGMHLFENVLRDFMHVERISGPQTLVVIDDVSPVLPEQAARTRGSRVWTGDVWKIAECLRKYRPDLHLTLIDAAPTGLMLVSGLDRANPTLRRHYNPIVREFTRSDYLPPQSVLERKGSIDPTGPLFERSLTVLREAKKSGRRFSECKTTLDAILLRGDWRRLSVIVIAYNMAREIPRTLLSLSPQMQRDLDADDYEIIVVDNGSTAQFDEAACAAIAPNIRFLKNKTTSISPVGAINLGLEAARGDVVGVLIDGARMASPGLLKGALDAMRISSEAVVGTLAFHLGPEVQMKSVLSGYNQQVEDELLSTVPWQEDGYRLFDISVLAGSSADGWFKLPLETNALFMSKKKWDALGGFDPGFQSAGGGLANHDV